MIRNETSNSHEKWSRKTHPIRPELLFSEAPAEVESADEATAAAVAAAVAVAQPLASLVGFGFTVYQEWRTDW